MPFKNEPSLFPEAYKKAEADIEILEARLKQLNFRNPKDLPEYNKLLEERRILWRVRDDSLPKYYK